MIIQHNLAAMNINRNLKINNGRRSSSSEKLSSGYRINRSADDAAGLSISEKMRAQIRGLDQASSNLQDGLSLLQTADGAMQEVHDVLQRIRELSVQGANDTYTFEDRSNIQEEIDTLIEHIDNIAEDTEFNEIKLLKGGNEQIIKNETTIGASLPAGVAFSGSHLVLQSLQSPDSPSPAQHATATIDFTSMDPGDIGNLDGKGFYSTCCTCDEKYSIRFTTSPSPSTGSPNPIINVDISGVTTVDQLIDTIIDTASPLMTHYTRLMKDPSMPGQLILYDWREDQPPLDSSYGIVGSGYIQTTITRTGSPSLYIQAGANENQFISIDLPNTTASSLGIEGVNVLSNKDASYAIGRASAALDQLSRSRSGLGAVYNRMEHAVSNVKNASENLSASESRIRDLDVAKEMVTLSKLNILSQAGQSIMAQANKNPQEILNLLQ
ncbi:MAG TPA: flagellar protein [Clostridiales bacterium]|nr:flagellar protein [Clostridiales bacterium]